jgi:hypothetical protein
VIRLAPQQEAPEPFSPARNPVPAEVVLEGGLQTFYVERNTVSSPFFSILTAPLGVPLTALSGLRFVPTPVSPFLPVKYHTNLAMQLRLCDLQTRVVV